MKKIITCSILLISTNIFALSSQKLDNNQIECAFIESNDSNLQLLINEAKPAIVEIVNKISCGAKGKQLLSYTAPNATTGTFATPLVAMFKHDINAKDGCLIPTRIHGWKKTQNNDLYFIVDYQSLQTGDTARRTYSARKQPDGAWLFGW